MSTIFSKIIRGEIPSFKIAEDEHHYAFLDINPIAEGHTLIVPKVEVDYFFDLPDDLYVSLMGFAKTVSRALDHSLKPLRTGVIVQGLEVPHAHVHLVPLYSEDQPLSLSHNVEVSEERMKELASQISNAVSS